MLERQKLFLKRHRYYFLSEVLYDDVPSRQKLSLCDPEMYAHLADPHWHHVGVGRAMVEVEDNHAEDDRECDQDHGKHDVVDDDGNTQRGLGDLISQQQQEHGEGEQHID